MKSSLLLLCIVLPSSYLFSCSNNLCFAVDCDNLQDTCPSATSRQQTIFINGFPCKNPANVNASDFKSTRLDHAGNTHNFFRSASTIITAADFPGLNTLGLAIARTDLDVDGLVMPHAHPRASEMFFVSKGAVIVGFIDSQNKPFQTILREGDVFMVPRGLLHYSVNTGFEPAIAFSILNSQNPGLVGISEAMFLPCDSGVFNALPKRLISLSALEMGRMKM